MISEVLRIISPQELNWASGFPYNNYGYNFIKSIFYIVSKTEDHQSDPNNENPPTKNYSGFCYVNNICVTIHLD